MNRFKLSNGVIIFVSTGNLMIFATADASENPRQLREACTLVQTFIYGDDVA